MGFIYEIILLILISYAQQLLKMLLLEHMRMKDILALGEEKGLTQLLLEFLIWLDLKL